LVTVTSCSALAVPWGTVPKLESVLAIAEGAL
jgi:hypothetical protein